MTVGEVTDQAAGSPLRILVVDDDALSRRSLVQILQSDPRLQVVGQADDGERVVDLARQCRAQIALLDVRMERVDGIAATAALTARFPECRVIVLTSFAGDQVVLRALSAGAQAFIAKADPPSSIIETILDVAQGKSRVSPAHTAPLVDRVLAREQRSQRARDQLAELSERELTVAIATADGLTNQEIAARLFCSEATVKSHLGHIFTKLGSTNRVRLAILVHEAELTDPSAGRS